MSTLFGASKVYHDDDDFDKTMWRKGYKTSKSWRVKAKYDDHDIESAIDGYKYGKYGLTEEVIKSSTRTAYFTGQVTKGYTKTMRYSKQFGYII